MKTREMINKIKIGETYISEHYKTMTVELTEVETLEFRDANGNPIRSIALERNWEKVRKALTFDELLKEVKNGDVITLEHRRIQQVCAELHYEKRSLGEILTELGQEWPTEEIADFLSSGKFYIEED